MWQSLVIFTSETPKHKEATWSFVCAAQRNKLNRTVSVKKQYLCDIPQTLLWIFFIRNVSLEKSSLIFFTSTVNVFQPLNMFFFPLFTFKVKKKSYSTLTVYTVCRLVVALYWGQMKSTPGEMFLTLHPYVKWKSSRCLMHHFPKIQPDICAIFLTSTRI